MSKFYLKDKNGVNRPIGPYPTYKMAEFMKGTYEALLKLELEVAEDKDE